jgi:hypothetical protein
MYWVRQFLIRTGFTPDTTLCIPAQALERAGQNGINRRYGSDYEKRVVIQVRAGTL